jgi:HSP20 family protein
MGNITRYDPYADMTSFRRSMDRWFDDAFARPLTWRLFDGEGLSAKIDVHQDDDNLYVTASLPGVKPEDVDVTVTGQVLSISGELKGEEDVDGDQYIYRERRFGRFSRQIELPVRIMADQAKAAFDNGLLKLTFPKAEDVKPRQIEIKVEKKAEETPAPAVKSA